MECLFFTHCYVENLKLKILYGKQALFTHAHMQLFNLKPNFLWKNTLDGKPIPVLDLSKEHQGDT